MRLQHIKKLLKERKTIHIAVLHPNGEIYEKGTIIKVCDPEDEFSEVEVNLEGDAKFVRSTWHALDLKRIINR